MNLLERAARRWRQSRVSARSYLCPFPMPPSAMKSLHVSMRLCATPADVRCRKRGGEDVASASSRAPTSERLAHGDRRPNAFRRAAPRDSPARTDHSISDRGQRRHLRPTLRVGVTAARVEATSRRRIRQVGAHRRGGRCPDGLGGAGARPGVGRIHLCQPRSEAAQARSSKAVGLTCPRDHGRAALLIAAIAAMRKVAPRALRCLPSGSAPRISASATANRPRRSGAGGTILAVPLCYPCSLVRK